MLLGEDEIGNVSDFFKGLFGAKPAISPALFGTPAGRALLQRQRVGGLLIQAGQAVNAAKARWGSDWRKKIGLMSSRGGVMTPGMQAALNTTAANVPK